MKYFAVLASLAATCLAQGLTIQTSTNGTVSPGQQMTVQVGKPTESGPTTEVAIVIAMTSCPNGECHAQKDWDITQDLGNVLYYGPFNPKYGSDAAFPQNQNFTVKVPPTVKSGDQVALSVTRFALGEMASGDAVIMQTPFIAMSIA
ncbi:hypothetical protein WOLCODRAFT_142845, partial [Wolfiporia cocos MD-104 SS10]